MAIENTLRMYPPDRWDEAIEAMGRHYAGDVAMRKPPLAIFQTYLARGPRETPAPAGPVKKGREWQIKKFVMDATPDAEAPAAPESIAVGGAP